MDAGQEGQIAMAVRVSATVADRPTSGTWREDLRAVRVVWKRELIRFSRDRVRIATSLAQPVLYLFIMGTGLSPLTQNSQGASFDYRTFMFPGIIAMTVMFTAIFSAVSIVWDREFGFLREMLVAPVRRDALVLGKCLGGATVATMQGAIVLALAGLVHVPYSPVLLLTLLGVMALSAFALTALGIVLASRMQRVESFGVVVQFFVMPMFLLSGALFPLTGLPTWLQVLTRLDPLTYAVDPMRRAVFSHVAASETVRQTLNPGVTWFGWYVPAGIELAAVAVLGIVALAAAVNQFSRTE
jgi:ABC-2 type transport system permease protein